LIAALQNAQNTEHAGSSCILRGGAAKGAAGRFEAPVRLPMKPLPKVDTLAATLRGARAPVVVMPHGIIGSAMAAPEARVNLLTLTPVSRAFGSAAVAVVLLADDRRLYRGMAGPGIAFPFKRVKAGDRKRLLDEVILKAQYAVVAFSADCSLPRWREVLGWFQQSSAEVVLALPTRTAIPAGVAQPVKLKDALARYGGKKPPPNICPKGISAVPAGKKRGDLGVDEQVRVRDKLTAAVQKKCGTKLAANQSGAVHVSVRLTGAGPPSKACLTRDFVGSEAVRQCVLATARSFTFPKPKRGDFVNLALQLVLKPSMVRLQPLCDGQPRSNE